MKRALASLCSPLSCALSLALYGRCEALCARAWAEDWRRWVAVMDRLMGPEPCGTAHCLASYVWWRCLSPAERGAARRARWRKWRGCRARTGTRLHAVQCPSAPSAPGRGPASQVRPA